MKSLLHKMVVTAGLFVCALTGASAQLLYDANGWEATGSPAWALGNIHPQNTWISAASSGTNAAHRVAGTTVLGALTVTPQAGTQMHRSISSSAAANHARWTWVDLAAAWTGRTAGNNTVVVSMDCFLPSSSSASFHQHGIDAYDPSGGVRLSGWVVQNDAQGIILFDTSGNGFGIGGVLDRDTWTHLDFVMDFNADRAELFINGVKFAGEAVEGTLFESVLLGNAEFGDADFVNFSDSAQPIASDFFTDNYRVEAVATKVFNGQIALEDIGVDDALSPVNVIFVLEDAEGNAVNAAYFVSLVSDTEGDPALGNYSVRMHDVADGTYKLFIKGFRHLSRIVDVTVAGGTVTVPLVTLRAGDANNDDAVDVFDLDALIQAFNSILEDTDPETDGIQPPEDWNPGADFNYDNAVDVFDLSILITNFNEVGEGA